MITENYSLEIRAGDFFAVKTSNIGGWFIRLKDWLLSSDCEATYNHMGQIVKADGDTLEARVHGGVDCYNLADWEGCQIVIFRPVASKFMVERGLAEAKKYKGRLYPWWRIILHALWRPLAKLGGGWWLVCSELWAYTAYKMGIRHKGYRGVTPDMAVDEMRAGKFYELVYEGPQHFWKHNTPA